MSRLPAIIRRAAFGLAIACLGAAQHVSAADSPGVWPTAGWATSTPEEQGMASGALADLVDFGAANAMDSLLVTRHGRIVAEAHYAPFRAGLRHSVNSVTKAVVGTLVGIALKDGTIARRAQPVVEFFPERTVADAGADKKAMTLAHLLDLTSGLDWREPLSDAVPETMLQLQRSRDWVGFVLDRPMAQAPGLAFNYNSGTWHLLSAVLTKASGDSTLDYARRKLFAPLGITDVAWRRDPQGLFTGGFGLSMHPRDMAKIGYLHLRGGEWAGQPLLPAAWTEQVGHASVDMGLGTSPAFRYANGWWVIPDRRAILAVGLLCQVIVVLPDADVVAVVTGRRHYPLVALVDRIVAAVKAEDRLPPDAANSARLAERITDAATEKPTPVGPVPALAQTVSARTYRFAANRLGLKSLMLDLTAQAPRYEFALDAGGPDAPARRVGGPIGLDGTFRLAEQGAETLLAVKASWLDDSRLRVVSRSLLEGIVSVYTLAFRGNDLDLEFEDNRGQRGRVHGAASD